MALILPWTQGKHENVSCAVCLASRRSAPRSESVRCPLRGEGDLPGRPVQPSPRGPLRPASSTAAQPGRADHPCPSRFPRGRAELRRHDILLQYQDEKVRDCEHLARLIHNDKPNRKVPLVLLRGGRETTVEVMLGLGPVLRIASAKTQPRGGDIQRGSVNRVRLLPSASRPLLSKRAR